MSDSRRILTILRAAHCRSTHHYFAIDALPKIATVQGQRLGRMLLKYHDEYLIGAKAPDNKFKDFQNHVLHVSDNYWGGAPAKCQEWFTAAVEHLDRQEWKKAAYACGVLSHYFTDPLMPLHTGSHDKESSVHRPLEWSVCKSYDEIYALVEQDKLQVDFELSTARDWIQQAVRSGATVAHQHYVPLMERYDLVRGCKNPPEGLDSKSRQVLAELFALAVTGWSKILARVADEATTEIPAFSLTLPTLLASLDMPLAWIVRKISDVGEQRAVKKILQEFEATGTVRRHAPAEVKVVERELAKSPTRALAREPISKLMIADARKSPEPNLAREPQTAPELQSQTNASPAVADCQAVIPESVAMSTAANVKEPHTARATRASDLVDAPSIGPKTAKRFEKIGIRTIADFLAADAEAMALQLQTRWITRELLSDWQAQAALVCDVRALCGYKAQLLVAVGCRTASDLANRNSMELSQQIATLATTTEGERILRSSACPEPAMVATWVESASSAVARQAA